MTRISRTWLLPAFLLATLACSNAGENFGFGNTTNGLVQVLVFFDRDGSLGVTAADTSLSGVKVGLVVAGGNDTAFTATTDVNGNANFNAVPLGNYTLVVDTTSIGDSLDVQLIDSALVTLRNNAPQQGVTVRLGFPAATVTEARALPLGTRVFVKGAVLAGPNTFSDTTAHISEGGTAIRLVNAANAGPATSPGDSVRVLGTVGIRAGQPVLDDARVNLFQFAPSVPAAVSLTTTQADDAQGGAQDAALVQLTNALITDTATVNGDFHLTVDDGSGALTVVLDQDILFPLAQFTPGKTLSGRGVLVPTGTGSWVFKPRANTDVQLT